MKEMITHAEYQHYKMHWETNGKGYIIATICKIYIHQYCL